MKEPPAEGDAICLVIEFLRINLIKVVQFIFLQDIRMEGGNAVDAEAIVDINMGHMDPVAFVDDGHGLVVKPAAHLVIQHLHDWNQLGHGFLKIFHGPCFQGFRQYGVVGVGAGPAYHLDGIVHFHAVFRGEQPYQFRYDHGRVCVIDLDDRIIGQVVKAGAFAKCF